MLGQHVVIEARVASYGDNLVLEKTLAQVFDLLFHNLRHGARYSATSVSYPLLFHFLNFLNDLEMNR